MRSPPSCFLAVILWAARAQRLILHMETAGYGKWQALAESFTAAVAAARGMPAEIVTAQEEAAALFQDLAHGLGIKVKKERNAKSFAAAKKSLLTDMGRRF